MSPGTAALGYIRRSKESGARTVSLEDQQARIADYCRAEGWALVEVLADDGVSGGRRERLDRLAERVKATGAQAIVVYHLEPVRSGPRRDPRLPPALRPARRRAARRRSRPGGGRHRQRVHRHRRRGSGGRALPAGDL